MMASPWLPSGVEWAWVVVFVAVAGVHLRHVTELSGRPRLWHSVHVLMAVGMIVMFWPGSSRIVPSTCGVVVFAVAGSVLVGVLLSEAVAGDKVGWLWLANIVDLAAMVYMFAMMSTRLMWLTGALVAWFLAQAAGWASGGLCTVARLRGLGGPDPVPVPAPVAPTTGSIGPRGAARRLVGRFPTRPYSPAAAYGVARGCQVHGISVRATLSAMSFGMAYMLLAMQSGMNAMSGMPRS